MVNDPHVFSLGHSNHSIETLLSLLALHRITAVADVRSSPFSRYSPQFNKKELAKSLESEGIKHVFLGRELGARTEDASCYENGRVQYSRLARTEPFAQGLQRVMSGVGRERIALLCTEKDPLDCHRTVLVSRELVSRGVAVDHILADGQLESHDKTMVRLLEKFGLGEGDLFHTKSELIDEALARQESAIAYVDPERVISDVEGIS